MGTLAWCRFLFTHAPVRPEVCDFFGFGREMTLQVDDLSASQFKKVTNSERSAPGFWGGRNEVSLLCLPTAPRFSLLLPFARTYMHRMLSPYPG